MGNMSVFLVFNWDSGRTVVLFENLMKSLMGMLSVVVPVGAALANV
jgi:hypothetical protein